MPANKTASKPSTTADLTAAIRALHVRDHEPPVFNDDLAFAMCSPLWKAVVRHRLLTRIVVHGILGKLSPVMPEVVVRHRWAEDMVEKAISDGVKQVVILGAGYDSLALRRRDLMARIRLWEIDQAATQHEKMRRMRKQGLASHHNVSHVPANLEQTPLHEVLCGTDLDMTAPAVFVWLGVSYYLTADATRNTLESIAGHMPQDTLVCMDYLVDEEHTAADWHDLRAGVAAFVAKRGEPWVSAHNPQVMPDFLRQCGFGDVDNLPPDRIAPLYLQNHPNIAFPEIMGFASARV